MNKDPVMWFEAVPLKIKTDFIPKYGKMPPVTVQEVTLIRHDRISRINGCN